MFRKLRVSPKCHSLVIRLSLWTLSEQTVIVEPTPFIFWRSQFESFLEADSQENSSALLPASYLFRLGVWFRTKVVALCKWDIKKTQFSSIRKWDTVLTAVEGGEGLGWPSPWGSVFSLINLDFDIFRKWLTKDFLWKRFLICIPNLN